MENLNEKSELKCNGKNVWLHRVSYQAEVSYPLLKKKEWLSIGYGPCCDKPGIIDAVIDAVKEKRREALKEKCLDQWEWLHLPWRWPFLVRFLAEMKKDDWVLVPMGGGVFSVYKIVGDRPLSKSEILAECPEVGGADLGFFWEVKPIAEAVSKKEFADAALTSRMKYQGTNVSATDLKQSVEAAVERCRNGETLNLHRQLMNKLWEPVLDTILSTLTPKKFERLVVWYFNRIGAKSIQLKQREKGKPSGTDADVKATFEETKTIIYAQAKRHKKDSETNDWAVGQISRYKALKDADGNNEYSTFTQVISTAKKYEDEAIKQAEKAGVELIDGPTFARMLLDAGFTGLPV